MNFTFCDANVTALQAQKEAQKIAFSPITFQVIRVLKEWNILKILDENNKKGISLQDICEVTKHSKYTIQLLLESAFSAGVVLIKDNYYFLSKVGYFLQNDKMTIANFDYNHYVNYLGMYHLDESLLQEKPIGLKYFGDWETIYPALSLLPKKAQDAWFAFDHFYSDSAFVAALEIVKKYNPKTVLDIGGNTGKFSLLCAATIPQANICIVDLPEQILLAKETIQTTNMENRVSTFATNILSKDVLPNDYDIIWMSQFLDCFSEKDVLFILKKIKNSMGKNSKVCILEPIWDRQRFETSAFCIINTSPYFTALANGKSKMFKSDDLERFIDEAGLYVESITDSLGFGHSLFTCKIK